VLDDHFQTVMPNFTSLSSETINNLFETLWTTSQWIYDGDIPLEYLFPKTHNIPDVFETDADDTAVPDGQLATDSLDIIDYYVHSTSPHDPHTWIGSPSLAEHHYSLPDQSNTSGLADHIPDQSTTSGTTESSPDQRNTSGYMDLTPDQSTTSGTNRLTPDQRNTSGPLHTIADQSNTSGHSDSFPDQSHTSGNQLTTPHTTAALHPITQSQLSVGDDDTTPLRSLPLTPYAPSSPITTQTQ